MKNPDEPIHNGHGGDGSGNGATPPGTPFLRIRNLLKRFGSFVALRNVNLDICKGEIVGVAGVAGNSPVLC